jgi:hypothetical protein
MLRSVSSRLMAATIQPSEWTHHKNADLRMMVAHDVLLVHCAKSQHAHQLLKGRTRAACAQIKKAGPQILNASRFLKNTRQRIHACVSQR